MSDTQLLEWRRQRYNFLHHLLASRFIRHQPSLPWHLNSTSRKPKLWILCVLMGKWIPILHWLPNQPTGVSSEKLVVTRTLPRKSVSGSIWIPVKLTLQNGKAQNEVAPSSSALIIKALGEPTRDRTRQLYIKYNGNITSYDIVKSTWQTQHRSLSREFSSTFTANLGTTHCVGCNVSGCILMTSTVVWWCQLVKRYKGKDVIKG